MFYPQRPQSVPALLPASLNRLLTRWAVFLVTLCCATSLAAQSPFLTLTRFDSGGSTTELFYFDLGNGNGYQVDQMRRQPTALRAQRLESNLFGDIGRPADQPAGLNEISLGALHSPDGSVRTAMLVEASTGYVVFFEQLGKNDQLGQLQTILGRPFGAVAADDGNFALLMRRSSSGRTEGAYLYHATTGKGVYYGGLAKISTDPKVSSVIDLPAFQGPISTTSILNDEQTISHALVDQASNTLAFLDLDLQVAERLTLRQTELKLDDLFAGDNLRPTSHRYLPVSFQNSDNTTIALVIVDVASGGMLLVDTLSAANPRTRLLPANLYSVIGGAVDRPRTMSAIEAIDSSGNTRGFWLLDSLTGAFYYVSRPDLPAELRIDRVAVERR